MTTSSLKPKKKKLDSRIKTMISNCVLENNRSFFVIVGDHAKDQIPNLHFLLSKQKVTARPSVLWCYSKELEFSSHRKKRMNTIKKEIKRGIRDIDQDDPFELFVSSTNIRYSYYKDAPKILGQTFGMLILSDFESLTPNLLAQTIETVSGGGIVVLLLKGMASLTNLYSLCMDVHTRFKRSGGQGALRQMVPRFNERFLLSLGSCDACLVVDDELNVLPISSGKNVKPIPVPETQDGSAALESESQKALKAVIEEMKDIDSTHINELLAICKTYDQAKALLTFIDVLSDSNSSSISADGIGGSGSLLKTTVMLTAPRGRGKSACLGLGVIAALKSGIDRVAVVGCTSEMVSAVFEFVEKGAKGLGWNEHVEYQVIYGNNGGNGKESQFVSRVDIRVDGKNQSVSYLAPNSTHLLSQYSLVVIDEAAAIPLPMMREILQASGNTSMVWMASTIDGYEGTGRSLLLKLQKELRNASVGAESAAAGGKSGSKPCMISRRLREIKLEHPIRYNSGDLVEKWLNNLLCLRGCDSSTGVSSISRTLTGSKSPHPSQCELYHVSRDTLFSYHPVSESFLHSIMSLFVSSHYKNTPNDLQMLSDAPDHELFVLLPPTSAETTRLPEPLVVMQVCLEGQIARGTALASLGRGTRASGDLIPWVLTQQFQDDEFSALSGARIVRIATHPDVMGMGYGARAIQRAEDYYAGRIAVDSSIEQVVNEAKKQEREDVGLLNEKVEVRDVSLMPPLLLRLEERPIHDPLHWFGVSYGVTPSLFKFWKRAGFKPVYVRQTTNDVTGEHTAIMVKSLTGSFTEESAKHAAVSVQDSSWIQSFSLDFKRRFLELLAYQFSLFPPSLVFSILDAASVKIASEVVPESSGIPRVMKLDSPEKISYYLSPFDMKRLESYAQNLLDYHVILDLVASISRLYFLNAFECECGIENCGIDKVTFSGVQATILIGMGLQKKNVETIEAQLGITVSQILALFAKSIRKVSRFLEAVVEKHERRIVDKEVSITAHVEDSQAVGDAANKKKDISDEKQWEPAETSLEKDLQEAGEGVLTAYREKQRELINSLDLEKYAVDETQNWENVKIDSKNKSGVVSMPSKNSARKRKIDAAKGMADKLMAGKADKKKRKALKSAK